MNGCEEIRNTMAYRRWANGGKPRQWACRLSQTMAYRRWAHDSKPPGWSCWSHHMISAVINDNYNYNNKYTLQDFNGVLRTCLESYKGRRYVGANT